MEKGTVRYPFYRNGGAWQFRGLKNKRRTIWAMERRMEQIRIENTERRMAEMLQEWEEQYGSTGQY